MTRLWGHVGQRGDDIRGGDAIIERVDAEICTLRPLEACATH